MAEKIVRPILTYADEAHHSAADTYQRIMNYFTPKLWLGMTATPDKRDDNIEGRNTVSYTHLTLPTICSV